MNVVNLEQQSPKQMYDQTASDNIWHLHRWLLTEISVNNI